MSYALLVAANAIQASKRCIMLTAFSLANYPRSLALPMLVILLSSCNSGGTGENGHPSASGENVGGEQGWVEQAKSAISSSEWSLERKTSNFDGDVLTASRTYDFPERNASFQVEIACKKAPPADKDNPLEVLSQVLTSGGELKIQSFVGDISSPAEQSAFIVTNFGADRFVASRTKNLKTGEVAGVFVPDGNYSNQARFFGGLGEALPMAAELTNGAGTFELTIDRSNEVEQVLAACGQDDASLARAEREAKERGKQEAAEKRQEEQRSACRENGQSTSETGGEIDCVSAFPEEFAHFQRVAEANATLIDDGGQRLSEVKEQLEMRLRQAEDAGHDDAVRKIKEALAGADDNPAAIGAADAAREAAANAADRP